MSIVRITDDTTASDIAETIAHVLADLRRLPLGAAWQARGHERINALLDDWECARMREELALNAPEPDGA